MNLHDPAARAAFISSIARMGLDELFRRAALRAPTRLALVDAPNRCAFADGAPRFVTYASADRMISAIAGRLHQFGLPRGCVIALQFPNMAEGLLALFGVLRAGMIAAPMPLLWRRAEIAAALGRVGAKAIIAGGRIGGDDLCEVALQAAAEQFTVRYVCGFGSNLPDGVIPLGELFTAERLEPMPPPAMDEREEAHLALITWEMDGREAMPVARNHAAVVAGGLPIMFAGRFDERSKILGSLNFASFGGFASTVLPWLLSGGTLVLHHAFDPQVFAEQCVEQECDCVIVPGPMVAPFSDAGLFAHGGLRDVIAVWRNPERLMMSSAWRNPNVALIDSQLFGETGLIAAARADSGDPASFSIGPLTIPRGCGGGLLSVEVARSEGGTLMLRGPMVPREPFPPVVDRGDGSCSQGDAADYVDTGYPCRIERESRSVVITGPPAGVVSVGSYRFADRALQQALGSAGKDATLAALPDPYLSNRLACRAVDRAAVDQQLKAEGANALVASAFRDRRKPQAA